MALKYTARGPTPGAVEATYLLAMDAILDCLQYPVGRDGSVLGISDGLDLLKPTIAYHLARCGIGPLNPPLIKPRPTGPGTLEDGVLWVPFDAPDDPLADVENMTVAEINRLDPDLKREAYKRLRLPLPEFKPPEGWHTKTRIDIVDKKDGEN